MAQALGGTYGLSHGAMNALTLPPALRFNAPIAPDAVRRFGAAIGNEDDPAAKVEELARLGGFGRLRDFDVSEGDLAAACRLHVAARRQPDEPEAGDPGRDREPFPIDLVISTRYLIN